MGLHHEMKIVITLCEREEPNTEALHDEIVKFLAKIRHAEHIACRVDVVETPGCSDPEYGGCIPTCAYCKREFSRIESGLQK